MEETNKFSLIRHSGPYELWPSRTALLVDGIVSSTAVPGYSLLRQIELPESYLLITDYDCPFEEAVTVIFLNKQLRMLSHRTIWSLYSSVAFKSIEWLDEKTWGCTR